jgi:hypothetical protein
MNPLVRAISMGIPNEYATRRTPGLVAVAVGVGEFATRARAEQRVLRTEVALIRLGALGSGSVSNWEDLLIGYLGELSHFHAASGWLSGLEHLVWDAVEGNPLSPSRDPDGFRALPSGELEDLRFLSQKVNGWPTRHSGRPEIVPLDGWRMLHQMASTV